MGDPTDAVPYGYDAADWGDMLLSYDGEQISYDGVGNPISDGTWTYTWEHGRELASMTDGTTTWDYSYNADGLRVSRTDGDTTYEYVYLDGQLVKLVIDETEVFFAYDASGRPMSFYYTGSSFYYYVTNLQGDVVGIIDKSGNLLVSYTYDAWGNVLSVTGSKAATLGYMNPLTYRGYVYDWETGLYYLQSRYYNPEWGRFINADVYIATGQGFVGNNMFAYCRNNPISRKDASGTEDVCVENFNEDNNPLNDLGNPTGRGCGGIWQSFTRTLHHAANGLKMASGQRDLTHKENHHLISNKHSTRTIECKEIADRYNYSLDHPSNLVQLQGHRGRHTNAYHGFIKTAVTELDAIADGNTAIFIEGMEVLGEFIQEYWWIPYAQPK